MSQSQEQKYLPVFVLLTVIITVQSFLIGQDQRTASFDRPVVTLSNTFVSETELKPPPSVPLVDDGQVGTGSPRTGSAQAPAGDGRGARTAASTVRPGFSAPAPSPSRATKVTTCEVDIGDNLWTIARRHDVTPDEILTANNLKSGVLMPGQVLMIPVAGTRTAHTGFKLYTVKAKDTAVDIATRLGVPLIDLVRENDLRSLYQIPEGTQLRYRKPAGRPGESTHERGHSQKGSGAHGPLGFSVPVVGTVGDGFGWRVHPIWGETMFHTGVDLQARSGDPIRASQDGRVIYAGWLRGYGKTLVIRHDEAYTTRYAHCSATYKQRGDRVKRGEKIGRVGSSGVSTGPHVHFEVRQYGKPLNPMKFLNRSRSG
ncbi:MAG: M23 family metallopeptidase [Candidatus Riflebacteria bacterium]|nr:M23 family metallopeptidase [Candidatus Riflebacteria bacterium]